MDFCRTTAKYPSALTSDKQELSYLSLGLSNEYGEFLDKVNDEVRQYDILKELGDIAWYLFRIFDGLELPMCETENLWYIREVLEKDFMVYCGRAQGIIKKVLRDDIDVVNAGAARVKLHDALIGCKIHLQYKMCLDHNSDLTKVLDMNEEKLTGRVERGTLCGDGDNR
jgi:NTP pyrophosphatase (non-canonical NTP hydrolase)